VLCGCRDVPVVGKSGAVLGREDKIALEPCAVSLRRRSRRLFTAWSRAAMTGPRPGSARRAHRALQRPLAGSLARPLSGRRE
jgi:hypothetical protein